jgi:hypothetical protein
MPSFASLLRTQRTLAADATHPRTREVLKKGKKEKAGK